MEKLSSLEGSLRDSLRVSMLGRLTALLGIRVIGTRKHSTRERELWARIDRIERLLKKLKRPARRRPRHPQPATA
jgi:hypothetical protein